LNEDDEDEEEGYADADVERGRHGTGNQTVAKRNVAGKEWDDGRAGYRDRGEKGQRRVAASASTAGAGTRHRGFELDMDNATLLGRRHGSKKTGASPLAAGAVNPVAQGIGSPMRVS